MSERGGDPRVLVEQIAKALVDAPGEVQVEQIDEGEATVFELTVAPNDVGRVIGRQGRTVRAMRTLLSAAGLKAQKDYELEILE